MAPLTLPSERRIRHHVNPLSLRLQGIYKDPLPVEAETDVEIELGCADARFLFERAQIHPNHQLIGLEIRKPLVDEVNLLAAERGHAKLRAYFCNINTDLVDLVPDGSIRRIFINFPDPWFKKRHSKRRLITSELCDTLARKLRSDGELFFQSDVFDLALDAMMVFESSFKISNAVEEWTFLRHNPYQAKSLREVRCEELGKDIWRMLYRLTP